MKKLIQNMHLYLGLITGIVVAITCLTGAILVFEDEIDEAIHPNRYFVVQQSKTIKLETMIDTLKKVEPKAIVSGINIQSDPQRTVSIRYREGNKDEAAFNPYTGELIETFSYRDSFLFDIFALHRWLLADDIGKFIVGTSTLIFLIILVTGIVLWFPSTKKIIKNRMKIKFNGGIKRLNYDVHIVLGFYSSIFLFIFAFTGLAWSFEWFNNGIYTVTNSSIKKIENPKSKVIEGKNSVSVDDIFASAKTEITDSKFYMIDFPKKPNDSFKISTIKPNAINQSAIDYTYFDQYSGKLISNLNYYDRNLGQIVRSTFKPVHTSAIFGLPSKIIGFIVCILGATFPITGLFIWLNKFRKKSKRKSLLQEQNVLQESGNI